MKVAVATATFFVFEIYKNKCYNKSTTIVALLISKRLEIRMQKRKCWNISFFIQSYFLILPNFPQY